ncbi:hypothetical protein KP005_19335 [Geomonas nitrogeniifigens]|uniref:DUF4136 domain-containing protein n=1 Tax=Geomonas diazotrophica TaxID=2843197 RepID=A0ABX8JHJ1_9BACT|nr:hypothetical protein [Geomonas nitrogeniifigens]QWV97461.1 hypothetical protein KP005_19335 [Geomonas nitrogeniifigens]
MKTEFATLVLMVVVLLSSGCARLTVQVDSLSLGELQVGQNYLLVPSEKDIPPDDLQFKEFSGYVESVLKEKGLSRVYVFDKAELAIFLNYGIGEPREVSYSSSTPIQGVIGYSSATTQGTISTYGNSSYISSTTKLNPQYGTIGYKYHNGSRLVFSRWLKLDAYDIKAYIQEQKTVNKWKLTATSSGRSGDLRRIFPLMLAGSQDYIGKNTRGKVDVVLTESDPEVLKIKGE